MKEIKLKEIKPGMVIHYKNDEEKKLLLEELERLGYVWHYSRELPTKRVEDSDLGTVIHIYIVDGYKYLMHTMSLNVVTHEFSDLILPELSAEEVLEIIKEICDASNCSNCPLHDKEECCICRENNFVPKKILKACVQWKADREKKTIEIEWVDVCRIIQIQDNGTKKCVYEEEIKPDEDLPYGGEKLEAERIFNNYIAEHDGNYIAVIEPVLKVKGE